MLTTPRNVSKRIKDLREMHGALTGQVPFFELFWPERNEQTRRD
jgi:hypothetical protein